MPWWAWLAVGLVGLWLTIGLGVSVAWSTRFGDRGVDDGGLLDLLTARTRGERLFLLMVTGWHLVIGPPWLSTRVGIRTARLVVLAFQPAWCSLVREFKRELRRVGANGDVRFQWSARGDRSRPAATRVELLGRESEGEGRNVRYYRVHFWNGPIADASRSRPTAVRPAVRSQRASDKMRPVW